LREPTFEPDGTRWTWTVYGPPLPSGDQIRAASAVSFPTRADAEANYRLHDHSKSDGHGRRLLTDIELNRLLEYAAQMSEGCNFNGRVVRSSKGADGGNWEIQWAGADNRTKHLMYTAVTKLRRSYNVLDE
jgi:hypothetical protein